MNLNNLKCLVDAADTGSISGAARKNFVSQQALSDQIRRLEEHFQTPLLERTRPLRLTDAGRLVYDAAREMQQTFDALEARVARLREPAPTLVISTGRTRTPEFLPRLITRFQAEMPGVEVSILCPDAVREEQFAPLPGADLIVGNLPFAPDVEEFELFSDTLCLVSSAELLRTLFGEDWRRQEQQMLRGLTLEECRAFPPLRSTDRTARTPLDFSSENMNNLDLALYRCRIGQEAMLLPLHLAEERLGQDAQMRFFPIVPAQTSFRVGIGARKGQPMSEAAQAFIRMARAYFAGRQ